MLKTGPEKPQEYTLSNKNCGCYRCVTELLQSTQINSWFICGFMISSNVMRAIASHPGVLYHVCVTVMTLCSLNAIVLYVSDGCDSALGMQSLEIPDSALTASSQLDADHGPQHAR